jgi:hypothetical protein
LRYRNLWQLFHDDEIFVRSRSCPGPGWFPVVNWRRVHGDRYTPYVGKSDWVVAANRKLALLARDNRQRRRGK